MRIPLGCPNFDRLLGGGIETGCVTMLYGEAGAGKTNVCLQAAGAVVDSDGKVAYIDSEGLSAERISQILGDGKAKNLLVSQVHSFEEQTDRIEKAGKLAENGVVSMFIVDSLTMFYRLKREDPKYRNEFTAQTEMLLDFARQFDVAVIVTSQVYTNMSNGRVEYLGGHVLGHNAKTILRLEKLDDGFRRAVVVKHRSLPEGRNTMYRIVGNGIEDV